MPQSDIIFALKLREAQYHSAQAEYNCEAIKLAEGEYNWKKPDLSEDKSGFFLGALGEAREDEQSEDGIAHRCAIKITFFDKIVANSPPLW